MEHRAGGSITVFLALVFLVILSLVMTSLEAARVSALKACAQMALSAGFESVAADFYRPLFDEYGLYAINMGFGDRTADASVIGQLTEKYLVSNLEFGEVESLDTRTTQMMTDCGGTVFLKQAAEAEQAVIAEYAVTALLQRFTEAAEQESTMRVLERKTEVESRLADIDIETVRLMRLIDGVDINVEALSDSGCVYRIADHFVKEFMIGEPNAVNTAINNPVLLEKLRPHYRNPIAVIDNIKSAIAEIRSCQSELEQAANPEVDNGKTVPENISGRLEGIVRYANAQAEILKELCTSVSDSLQRAEEQLSKVISARDEMKSEVMEYEEFILNFSGSVQDEVMSGLIGSLNEMKSYVGLANSGHVVDYTRMAATLEADSAILSECTEVTGIAFSTGESVTDLDVKEKCLEELQQTMTGFSYDGLSFDYSGFAAEAIQDSIYDAVKSELGKIFSDIALKYLLASDVEVSDATIDTGLFPCIDDSAQEVSSSDISESSPINMLADILSTGVERIYEKALLTLYTGDRFGCFADKKVRSNRVLRYEQEFIVAGNTSDKENLISTASQILLLRMVPNVIFVLTDEDTTEQAGSAAGVMVGMLGMPFLTAAVKTLILLIWAAEQAVVETAAVYAGVRVPIITGKSSFCIDFAEIPFFTPELVRSKVKAFRDTSRGLSYKDYLKMLLLIRPVEITAQRQLGLIQENIRYAYDDNFLMCNCATELYAVAEISCEELFIPLFPHLSGTVFPDRYSAEVSSAIKY